MKKYLLTLYLLFIISQSFAQYTTSPSSTGFNNASFSTCGTNQFCDYNYLGGEIKMFVDRIVGNTAYFRIVKCAASANPLNVPQFSTFGYVFLKRNSLCGVIENQAAVSGTSTYYEIAVTLTPTQSITDYYAVYIPDYDPGNPYGNYARYGSGKISVTGSNTSTQLNEPLLTYPTQGVQLAVTGNITLQWNKNENPSGTDYQIRLHNLTDDNYPLNYLSVGDVSSKGVNISFGKSYQWVVRAVKSGYITSESAPTTFQVDNLALNVGSNGISPTTGIQNSTVINFSAFVNNINAAPYPAPTVDLDLKRPDGTIFTQVNLPLSNNHYIHSQTMQQSGTYQYRFIAYQGTRTNKATDWVSFNITPPAPPVTISSFPSTVKWNCQQSINWTSVSGTGNISIELINSADNTQKAVLGDNLPNTGSFNWQVGKYWNGSNYDNNIQNFESGTYKVKIYPTGTYGQDTQSPSLTVNVPTISISQPTATSYVKGTNMNINWSTSSTYCGPITIQYTNASDVILGTLANAIANTGSFVWSIPTGLADGQYKIKMHAPVSSGSSPVSTISPAFTLISQSLIVTSPTASSSYSVGSSLPVNWSFTGYTGNVSIELTQGSSGTSMYRVIADPTPNDGSENWTIPNDIPAGQYRVKVYNTGSGSLVNYSGVFTINADSNCPNCITGQTVANFTTTGQEGFCAAQYLCDLKIIEQAQSNPTNPILREDVAKITTIALLDDPKSVNLNENPNARSFPADNFPVPYNDLSLAGTCCTSYHRYAKVLSYLDYGDGMPPFVRRASFNPGSTIQRIDLLQVYLEAWNIDESTASGVVLNFNDLAAANLTPQQVLYLKKAVQLQLVDNGTAGSPIAFRPTVATTREEAFLILKRLRTSTMVTKPSESVVLAASSYFTPANLTPQNLSIARGMGQGNFSHYSEAGFSIPDIGFSLRFSFQYNSFLTELPDDWKLAQPLGNGWTHNYNTFLFTTIVSDDAVAKPLLVISWPDGTFDTYDNANMAVGEATTVFPNHARKISLGNYDILTRVSISTYTVKKKDQTILTFTKQSGETGLFRLTAVTDKNGNTLNIVYKAGQTDAWDLPTKQVIDYVQVPSGRRATFSYNVNNQITQIAFPGVNNTSPRNLTFTYNGRQLKTFKDARGQVLNKSTTYNYGTGKKAYLLEEIILPKGNKVVNGYNENGKLENTKMIGSNNATTSMATISHPTNYNSAFTTTSTDLANIATVNTYNTNGLTDQSVTTGITTTNTYDANHPTQLASLTSAGISYTFTHYANGNMDVINYPASIGGYEKYTYDTYNNPLTHRDAKGIITTMTYPDNKNVATITKPVGDGSNINQSFSYYPNGLPQTSTDNEGVITQYSYNNYGNLNSVNIPAKDINVASIYHYASRKTSVTDARVNTTNYTYDENSNLKTETDALNHVTTYVYDDNDNLSTITNAKGKVTTLGYDDLDRNISQEFGGKTKTFIYDDATNRLSEFRKAGYAADNSKKFIYTYDSNTGLLKSNGYIQNINYDAKLRMSEIRGGSDANHQLTDFTYDDMNRLKSYKDHYTNMVGYDYDLNGNIQRIDYPNGHKLYKTYDNLNRLKTLTWDTNLLVTYNYVGSRLDNMVYGNGVKTKWTYDNAGRPENLNIKTNNGAGATIFSSNYVMDKNGNHTTEDEVHPYPNFTVPTQNTSTYSYSDDNRLISSSTGANTQLYGYDNDGNVINKGSGNNLSYDLEDNLTGASATTGLNLTATYDAFGNRRSVIRNGIETRYIEDINGGIANILAETNATNTVQNYYIHGTIGLAARIKADGTIHYYHGDFRGSTVAMTNTSQAITHKYQYDEFGNLLNSQEADFNAFRYVGAYGIMFETNDLAFMRARYYDPNTGRFNSEDPIWASNLYPYAGNNGVMNVDLTGLESLNDFGGQILKENLNKSVEAWTNMVSDNLLGFCSIASMDNNNNITIDYKGIIKCIVNNGMDIFSLDATKIIRSINSAYAESKKFYEDPKKYFDKLIEKSARLHPAFPAVITMVKMENYIKQNYRGQEQIDALYWLVSFGGYAH